MRLIDADEYLKKQKPKGISDELWEKSTLYKSVMAEPTVEAEPVRHGRWFVRRYGCSKELVIDCSACNDSAFSLMPFEMLVRGFKYCPNCGAKMDERKEE